MRQLRLNLVRQVNTQGLAAGPAASLVTAYGREHKVAMLVLSVTCQAQALGPRMVKG